MFKVGLIGSGFMGRFHARSWAKTPATLAGVTSLDPAGDQMLCEQYGAQRYETIEELLDAVDVVDICTPTHLHHEMVLQAARAGKHIVCEKPLALTGAHADEMVAVCKEAGVKLMVAQVVRFFPEYANAKKIVDSGELGPLGTVRLKRVSSGPKLTGDNWFADFSKSGGMVLDLMIHDFDFARWVAGEVESVFVKSVMGTNPDAKTDYALAILRHTNGTLSHVEGGWAYPAPMFRTSLEIAGEHGLIEHPAGSATPIGIHLKQQDAGYAGVPTSPMHEDPYTAEIKHFYDVIANDATPIVVPEDGAAAVKIGLAAIESARTGQRIRL